MGRAYTVNIPASGVGVDPIPISVSGATFISGEIQVEIAYDPADFASDQFTRFFVAGLALPIMHFAPNTILWVRQPPSLPGLPPADLSVLTQIGSGGY